MPSQLTKFCIGIRDYEGGPHDRNYRNNNPGNCRYSPVGYLPMYGHVRKDKDGFAIFKDYATGFLYLQNLVKHKIQQNPHATIQQFMAVYAPTSDGNDPVAYANFLGRRLGVDSTSYQMGNLII